MSRKPLRRDLPLDIRGGLEEVTTPHAGVAGLLELGRRSNVMAAAEKYLPAKQSPKGLGQGEMVESFVVLRGHPKITSLIPYDMIHWRYETTTTRLCGHEE